MKIRIVLIWFVVCLIPLSSYGTGFGFRDGAIGRYYTSSNMLFDQYSTSTYNPLSNQPPITDQTMRSSVVQVTFTYVNVGLFAMPFLKSCSGTIIGNNIQNGVVIGNQYWVLTASSCLNRGAFRTNGAWIVMNPQLAQPATIQDNRYLAASSGNDPAYFNLQGTAVRRAQIMELNSVPLFRNVPVTIIRGDMALVLFQVTNQPGIPLPVSINTTMHLASGVSGTSDSVMAVGFGQQTIIRNGGTASGSSKVCFLNGRCRNVLKLNYTYLQPMPEFYNTLLVDNIHVNDYVSYSCFGDDGGPLLVFNPWQGAPRFSEVGLISPPRTLAQDGVCAPNLATSANPAAVHFFTPMDITWITTMTGLTNLP